MLILTRKFAGCSYRLHMAGIKQNKQKCLVFIVVSPSTQEIFLIRLDQMEENLTLKNK